MLKQFMGQSLGSQDVSLPHTATGRPGAVGMQVCGCVLSCVFACMCCHCYTWALHSSDKYCGGHGTLYATRDWNLMGVVEMCIQWFYYFNILSEGARIWSCISVDCQEVLRPHLSSRFLYRIYAQEYVTIITRSWIIIILKYVHVSDTVPL